MRHLTAFFFSLSVIILICSCSTEGRTVLTAADFNIILENSFTSETLPMDHLEDLDPYDAYFLALKASELGYYDEAVVLARYCWKNSGGFIGERAAELSIRLHLEQGDFSGAEFLSSIASAEYPDNFIILKSFVEAEYWQREDRSVLLNLSELEKLPEAEEDGELQLFRAVSSYRLNTIDWKDEWVKLFMTVPASEFIRRGWDYLTTDSVLSFNDFGPYEKLFQAKYAHSIGEYREASSLYKIWFEESAARFMQPSLAADIEKLYIAGGRRLEGARLIEDYCGNSVDSLSAAARLYRRAGRYSEADRCMDLVLALSGCELSERDLWYSLDIKIRRNLSNALDSLDFYIEKWEDPQFFSDSLNNLCTSLAGRGRWADITMLALKLEDSGPPEVYDRSRYISERAASLNWIDEVAFTGSYSTLYYRILSGNSLDELYDLTDLQRLAADCSDIPEPRNDAERFIDGLLRYKTGSVLNEIRIYREDLSEDFLVYSADSFAGDENYLDSIRIMYQFVGSHSSRGYKALYPDFYRSEIESVSKENSIPPQVMFALVWKESGFENEIVSRSGAIGLSQLMPATAADVAGRQKRAVGDLTDPVENLELGAWYLNWLKGYVGNTASAVLSYNGGPGRVKGWIRSWPRLPDDLLYEVVPVLETHLYGKKVLEAAVFYGQLYYGIDPAETLKIFFQEKV